MPLQHLPLTAGPVALAGAVSLDITSGGIQPWRINYHEQDLFEPELISRALHAAGVRLTLCSDTATLCVDVDPLPHLHTTELAPNWTFDLLIDGQFHQRQEHPRKPMTLTFENLPAGEHLLELYFYQFSPIRVTGVRIDADASARPFVDDRPKWVVYGSSITQCRTAAGPSQTWPAIIANHLDLNLTCLGFGGNCHLEPMVARTIRDQPADYISLCLGINVQGASSLSLRTFRAAVIGFIKTIRDGHPDTPMIVVSPICSPPRETTPNAVGLTLVKMRELIADAVARLTRLGDANLRYVDGLELFGPDCAHHLPDQLHPDAQGYRVLAQRYEKVVMPRLGIPPQTHVSTCSASS